MGAVKVGFLHSLIRKEEKLLIGELEKRHNVELEMLDDRRLIFDLQQGPQCDVVIERSINHARALHALRLFGSLGIPCVNSYGVSQTCGDKILTAVALYDHGVPQPALRIAFTEESALEAIEDIGYPVVLKPAVGSWGRLLSKVNDRDAAETILEHKTVLGSYHHSIFFVQKYVQKKAGISAGPSRSPRRGWIAFSCAIRGLRRSRRQSSSPVSAPAGRRSSASCAASTAAPSAC